jgi:hypothetical protein
VYATVLLVVDLLLLLALVVWPLDATLAAPIELFKLLLLLLQ